MAAALGPWAKASEGRSTRAPFSGAAAWRLAALWLHSYPIKGLGFRYLNNPRAVPPVLNITSCSTAAVMRYCTRSVRPGTAPAGARWVAMLPVVGRAVPIWPVGPCWSAPVHWPRIRSLSWLDAGDDPSLGGGGDGRTQRGGPGAPSSLTFSQMWSRPPRRSHSAGWAFAIHLRASSNRYALCITRGPVPPSCKLIILGNILNCESDVQVFSSNFLCKKISKFQTRGRRFCEPFSSSIGLR